MAEDNPVTSAPHMGTDRPDLDRGADEHMRGAGGKVPELTPIRYQSTDELGQLCTKISTHLRQIEAKGQGGDDALRGARAEMEANLGVLSKNLGHLF